MIVDDDVDDNDDNDDNDDDVVLSRSFCRSIVVTRKMSHVYCETIIVVILHDDVSIVP